MPSVQSSIHSAISIVNAIATGKGATLGISKRIDVTIKTLPGKGITIESNGKTVSSRLINEVIKQIIPTNELDKTKLKVSLSSEIPTGYGLKSSSAISSAVSLGCAKLFRSDMTETEILRIGVDASIKTKVSLTGAYDDTCGCYYGGFNVTDNYKKKIIHSEKCLDDISAIIFLPKSRKRGKIKKLGTLANVFERAWNFARNSDYWNAMIMNGLATSAILDSDPKIISELIQNGALGASISGNGPSIAAVAKNDVLADIKKIFARLDGKVTTTEINNKKAEVYEV